MRITYDPRYDVLHLKIGKAEKVSCKEIDEDITIDTDSDGRLVGIEILDASKHIDLGALLPIEVVKGSLRATTST
jgi:uncharacterized protein YuzE